MANQAHKQARSAQIRRVLLTVLILNLIVSIVKIVCGSVFASEAVRADGIHSIFDCAANAAGIIGITFASRPADADHPYGHSKFETVASLVIGLMLLVAAVEVGWSAVNTLMAGTQADFSIVNLVVMLVTLCINIGTTTYERRAVKRVGSDVLDADSKHTLSDALVSCSVIIGLAFVWAGFPIADSIAALVVTVAILISGFSVLKDVQATFSDEARIDPESMYECARGIDGVIDCHAARTRGLESEVYADLHILVDPQMDILDAHKIGDEVEAAIEARFPQVAEVVIHLEPATPEELREQEAIRIAG